MFRSPSPGFTGAAVETMPHFWPADTGFLPVERGARLSYLIQQYGRLSGGKGELDQLGGMLRRRLLHKIYLSRLARL